MNARFTCSKAKGQSLPLIALMIVVLVAMVGLAVDVGNTYAEQRNTQRSSNAAAIAAMNSLIAGGDDASVYGVLVNSLKANNINVAAAGSAPQPGERLLVANYLDSSGNPLSACPNVGSNCSAATLQSARYIRVEVSGKVETYFARVVGRPDLPVGADSWVGRTTCASGIYPILVRDQLLGNNGFINSEGTYSDSNYRNKTVKTILLHDPVNNPSGGFNWARWSEDAGDKERGGLAVSTEAMMTGPGNISGGFDEAPWPEANNLNLPKPTGYPLFPHQLTGGDWIYPNTGVSNSSGLQEKLNYHIANKTVLNLPIWDVKTGSGNASSYHTARLGAFILISYNLSGSINGTNPGYIKLAYIGNSKECAVLFDIPSRDDDTSVTGEVEFRPRFREVPQSRPPVQYEIILDVSGSMSWTYEGYGWKDGKKTLCTGANANCQGYANAWPDETKRRIYFAKNAIKSFIDQMGPNDTMRIVSFTGQLPCCSYSPTKAVNGLTKAFPTSGWSSDKATLKSSVDAVGAVNGDKYKTDGRTPSSVGIARGSQEFGAAPTKSPVTNEIYKRVAIFMTDGVANIRRNGEEESYKDEPGCGSEIASCNVGDENGVLLPITAALAEADTLKQYAQVYAIAMAGVDETGLSNIASAPNAPFYSTSQNGGDLQTIFNSIATDVKEGTCVPKMATWEQTMDEAEVGNHNPAVTYPTVGYVYLTTENGGALPNGQGKAPIQVNPESGRLFYRVDGLPPGTYQLRASLAYKGEDNTSRIYSVIYSKVTETSDTSTTIIVDPTKALGSVIPMGTISLDLNGTVC
jgi:hypothetical protein